MATGCFRSKQSKSFTSAAFVFVGLGFPSSCTSQAHHRRDTSAQCHTEAMIKLMMILIAENCMWFPTSCCEKSK
eukprot:3863494-Amphidinium_carterae.2